MTSSASDWALLAFASIGVVTCSVLVGCLLGWICTKWL